MDKDEIERYKNRRISVLSMIAFVTIIVCLCITVWTTNMDEYAKGIITLILGRFLGYADQVYAFDFNTTRSSGTKDSTIATLSQKDSK